MERTIKLYEGYLNEELEGKTDLHLPAGYIETVMEGK